MIMKFFRRISKGPFRNDESSAIFFPKVSKTVVLSAVYTAHVAVQSGLISVCPLERGNRRCPSERFFLHRPKQETSEVELKERRRKEREGGVNKT